MTFWVALPPPSNLLNSLGQPVATRLPALPRERRLDQPPEEYILQARGLRRLNGLDLPGRAVNESRTVGTFQRMRAIIVDPGVGAVHADVVTFDAGRASPEIVSTPAGLGDTKRAVTANTPTAITEVFTNTPAPGTTNPGTGRSETGTDSEEELVYSEAQEAANAEYAAQQSIYAAGVLGAAVSASYGELPTEAPYVEYEAPIPVYQGYVAPTGGGGGGVGTVEAAPPVEPLTYEEYASTQDALEQYEVLQQDQFYWGGPLV